VAGVFGTGTDLRAVRTPELLVLGLGSTAAVTAHAGAQWWGAWRVGIRLRPRAGWRDADVRRLAAGGLPSLGYAALNSFRYFAIIVVANRVPGGVVAFQLAFNFMYVPVALGAYPVAVALLPDLSRLYLAGALQRFRDALVRGASLMFFLAIPAAVAAVFLAGPLSRAMAFGEMADARGRVLVAASLTALGVGLLGEAWWVVGTHAAYAREDARAPFRSMIVRIAVTVVGMGVAFSLGGTAVLVVLGLAVSAGNIVGSVHLAAAVRRRLPRSSVPVMPAVARAAAAALVMAGPAYAVAGLFGSAPGRLSSVAAIAVAGAVGASLFLAVQWALRSPELRELREGFGDLGRRGGRPHRP
jgi:putative peptidoglycan lipid II flippase